MGPPIGEKGWILDLPIVHNGLGLAGAERRHRSVVAVVCSSIHNSTDWRVNYCNLQMTIIIVIFFFRSTNHLCRLPPCPRSRPGGTVRCWCPRSCGTGTCPAAPPGTPTPSRRQTENIPVSFSILTSILWWLQLHYLSVQLVLVEAALAGVLPAPHQQICPLHVGLPTLALVRERNIFLLNDICRIFMYLGTTLLLLARAGAVPHAWHAGVQPEEIHWQWSRRQREQ